MPRGPFGMGELQPAHQQPGYHPYMLRSGAIAHGSTVRAGSPAEERQLGREARAERRAHFREMREQRAAERAQREARRAQRQGASPGGGADDADGIDPRTGMISRSRARATVARFQKMAAGSPQITGEDLERSTREANVEARERHEATQAYHRAYGAHRPILGGFQRDIPSFEEWESTAWQKMRGQR